VYLSDLTFIEDGNQDEIRGLINFSKRKLLHMVISQLQRYQNDRPKFPDRLDLCTLLYDINAQDENALYELSLQREPRGCNKQDLQ
jgi:RasGEF domain